jgi:hypothetical protein
VKVTIGRVVYCCGTCALWRHSIGCTMRASPATVNCGRTRFRDLCEQWHPSHLSTRIRRRWKVRRRQTALDHFRAKIDTPERRFIRMAHYRDNAIYGADT